MKFKIIFTLLASSLLMTLGPLRAHAQESPPPTRAEFNELQRQLRYTQKQASADYRQLSTFDFDRQVFNREILPDLIKARKITYALMTYNEEHWDIITLDQLIGGDPTSPGLLWERINRYIRPETLIRIQNGHRRKIDAVRKHLTKSFRDYLELFTIFGERADWNATARYHNLQKMADDLTFLMSLFDGVGSGTTQPGKTPTQ